MKYIKYLRNGKMDKNLKITIVIGIIIAIAVIGLALINESNNAKTQVSPLTDIFDYSSMPITTWDNNTKTYTFDQNISSVNGKDYKDITMSIIFYKDNVKINNYTENIAATENGTFNLNFSTNLQDEPDEFYYDVQKATEV